MNLDKVAAPALPVPGPVYDRLFQQQQNNILRLFFSKLTAGINALFGTHGGQYISTPAASFSSTTTQSVAAAATPTRVTLSVTDYASGLHYTPGNGIHTDVNGIYNVQFSVQVTNNDSQAHDIDIWVRKNGVDVPNTASVSTVQSTHGGIAGYQIVAANFFIPLVAEDYIELWWAASNTSVQLNYLPAITTPFVSPGSPSVVVTLNLVNAS